MRTDQTLYNLLGRAGNLLGRTGIALAVAASGCGRLGFEESDGLTIFATEVSPYTISKLELVHAKDGDLAPLHDVIEGARFGISSELPDPSIAIEAVVEGGPAYVRFEVNDGSHDEFAAPFISAENPDGKADHDASLHVGSNIIVVSAFDDAGVARTTAMAEFTIDVPIAGTLGIASIELIDNYNGNVLRQISNGAQVPMSALASTYGDIDIRITPNPGMVGSVLTTLSGPITNTFVDDWPVYTAFGPTSGFHPIVGTYTITTTAFELGAALGSSGAPRTITFQIIP